ncbi:hypothetical protein [Rubrobacter aplysinae]|uniref:hypothetical protein n=1 Tax=Rubrobacter aplysinae TaxID=909625 RepID=UPI00064BBF5C|nr:hypothetical protein [Rubrobacter aplysinae]
MRRLLSGLVAAAVWLASMMVVPGGGLWALTPMGITLAESRLPSGADGFWQLFATAPLLLLVGVVGLHLRGITGGGLLRWASFLVVALGLALVAAGNVGQFWLGVDDVFILAAPGYRAFRIGLLVAAAGSVVLGVSALKDRTVPSWTVPPFLAAAMGGLIAFAVDLGSTGAALWALFGLGWVWLGAVVFVRDVVGFVLGRYRRDKKAGGRTAGEAG